MILKNKNEINIKVKTQTLGEEIANAVSHGLGAALAVAGTVLLIIRACFKSGALGIVAASLFGASMIILYTISCLYHSLTNHTAKKVFRIFDHCSIFLLILGTYIPISLVSLGGALGWTLFGVITACAVIGIVFNSIDLVKWQKISLVLYLVMGWAVVAASYTMIKKVDPMGLILLLLGGIFYTVGIIFYKQKDKKYRHFIWHIFVLFGSITHYFCIFYYCYI